MADGIVCCYLSSCPRNEYILPKFVSCGKMVAKRNLWTFQTGFMVLNCFQTERFCWRFCWGFWDYKTMCLAWSMTLWFCQELHCFKLSTNTGFKWENCCNCKWRLVPVRGGTSSFFMFWKVGPCLQVFWSFLKVGPPQRWNFKFCRFFESFLQVTDRFRERQNCFAGGPFFLVNGWQCMDRGAAGGWIRLAMLGRWGDGSYFFYWPSDFQGKHLVIIFCS